MQLKEKFLQRFQELSPDQQLFLLAAIVEEQQKRIRILEISIRWVPWVTFTIWMMLRQCQITN